MTEQTTPMPVEKTDLNLGYMPLTDSLPLIAAQELGYFRQQGLQVTLHQEVSWANIRDKLLVGHFDAAHMLAPMLLATHLGLGCLKKPMQAASALALNGNALTISNQLAEQLDRVAPLANLHTDANKAARALKTLIQKRHARQNLPPQNPSQQPQLQPEQQDKLVFAIVFPFSVHNLMLRDWLANADIDPDNDVQLVVLPPSQMVDHLRQQHIDGFFAGAPWNSVAIRQGVGQCLLAGPDIRTEAPDKVLGVTQDWAQQHPNTLNALQQALLQGKQWCAAHPQQAAEMLASYLALPVETLLPALTGEFIYQAEQPPRSIPDMLVFDPERVSQPKREDAQWFLQQMQRWSWLAADCDIQAITDQCYPE